MPSTFASSPSRSMRSLEHARESWLELEQYRTLRELKDGVRLETHSKLESLNGFRSAAWKAFLLFDSVDVTEWQRTLASSRSAFNSLRTHFFRYLDHPEDVGAGAGFDPLSQDSESSPWAALQKDEELRAEITQDVERCMPDNLYFRLPETQRKLLDILFIFCKLNGDVGYRQGMHEIAAPVLWVVENDAIEIGGSSRAMGQDGLIKSIFDAEYIEHDTFAIFGQVMQAAKTFYLSEGLVSIAGRSHHIFTELLPQVDPELKAHLEGLDIVPQVFLIRWIRLLFGREFEFGSVLTLWDVIFAEDPSLEIVDHICLAMLLRIRWHLLDSDYNNALGYLLRYPEPDKDFPAQSLGLDALYLKTHMNAEGGSYLVLKYTGRPLLRADRPATPPALQRNVTTFSGINVIRSRTGLSPSRSNRQSRNIETVLQSTAKNIFAQGEKLGIGKAVRNAVEEVQKKAQEIRENQTPPQSTRNRPADDRLVEKLKQLEDRNKKLAELLSGAVTELWDYQKLVTEDDKASGRVREEESVEKLSTAVAKVQFVQVYLSEPGLSLPDEEQSSTPSASREELPRTAENQAGPQAANSAGDFLQHISPGGDSATSTAAPHALADPASFEDFDDTAHHDTNPNALGKSTVTNTTETNQRRNESVTLPSTPSRPSLEQSAFSFMLGQDVKSTPSPPSRTKLDASLFGSEPRHPSASKTPGLKNTGQGSENQSDEFDLGSLRRGKGLTK